MPLQLLIQGYFLRVSDPTEYINWNWVLSMFKYFVSSPEDREEELYASYTQDEILLIVSRDPSRV